MKNIIKNKIVYITGGNTGIGKETAYKFAEAGAKIAISYYENEKNAVSVAVAVQKACIEKGASDAIVVSLNLLDDRSIKKAIKSVVKKFGKIDILINNAGTSTSKFFTKQSNDEIVRQVRTNLEGLIKNTKEALPHVKEMIINIASAAGKEGIPYLSVYCASKFGIRGFTQALAKELPEIKIYAVNPKQTATRMTNFRGVPAEKIAQVILNTAEGKYRKKSGSDIDA
jgi:3-oxoacyl-[acyl-carrier protein] reductase